jgi:hypothetical protein
VFGRTTRLDLHGFGQENRLQIIRIVRNLASASSQEDWDMFCHKIALPLRDGKLPMERIEDSVETVLVTRRRYDRLACLFIPLSVAVSVFLWWRFALPQFFVFPPSVVGAWLLLRFNVPKEGRSTPKVTSFAAGRAQLAGLSTVVLAHLLFLSMLLAGFGKNVACTVTSIFLVAGMVPFFVWQVRADKERKARDLRGAETAGAEWQRGEDELPATDSC